MKTHLLSLAVAASIVMAGCTSEAVLPKDIFGGGVGQSYREDTEFSARVEQLAQGAAPAIVLLVEERDAMSALFQVQSRNGLTTWLSPDNSMIVLDRGLLTATRGLGLDLMEAKTSAVTDLVLAMKAGHATHHYAHLNGMDQITPSIFRCTISNRGIRSIEIGEATFATQLMKEHCENGISSIRNLYWVGLNGKGILQSRQWVSPEVGMISVRIIL